jgi:hypothetical protein
MGIIDCEEIRTYLTNQRARGYPTNIIEEDYSDIEQRNSKKKIQENNRKRKHEEEKGKFCKFLFSIFFFTNLRIYIILNYQINNTILNFS